MTTIALIGAPGSGKSTIGPLLAGRLGVGLVDVDATIEARDGRLVREIFAEDGEQAYRALEQEITLTGLAAGGVVALGSGGPLAPAIAQALRDATTVWLQVDGRHAARRLRLDAAAASLGAGLRAALIRQLNQRAPLYAATATHHVDTSGREPAAIVDDIIARLEATR